MIDLIYFDMDGVLANLAAGFDSNFSPMMTYCMVKQLPKASQRGFIDQLLRMDGFFAELKPHEYSVQLLKDLILAGYRVEILSSIGSTNSESIRAQKVEWLSRNCIWCPTNFVSSGGDKAAYATPNALLLDDYISNCEGFRMAGGEAVHIDEFSPERYLVPVRDRFISNARLPFNPLREAPGSVELLY